MRPVVGHQAAAQHLVGRGLQRRVQAGADHQAALGRGLRAEAVDHLAAHLLAEPVRPGDHVRPVELPGDDRPGLGGGGLLGGDRLVVHHAVQHPVPPVARGLGEAERVVVVRRLGQRGQEGGLRQGDLVQRLVEVGLRRRGHAVGLHAEVDLVQVQLEDAVLGQRLLHPDGEHGLLDLALHGALVAAQQHVARDLLGDGGGADRAAAAAHLHQVGEGGARHRTRIDALVGPEVLVLGGDEGLLDHVRDGGERHEDAPLLCQLGDQARVAGVDAAHHRRLVLPQAVHGRQLGGQLLERVVGDGAAQDAATTSAVTRSPASRPTIRSGERRVRPGLVARRRLAGAGSGGSRRSSALRSSIGTSPSPKPALSPRCGCPARRRRRPPPASWPPPPARGARPGAAPPRPAGST